MKDGPFAKTGKNRKIQQTKKVRDKVQSSRQSIQEVPYRKVSTYTKSAKRYKLERERRRQVRLLIEKGFSQQQVAEELGVSIRTVKRDWLNCNLIL